VALTSLGDNAFEKCVSLTTIELPAGCNAIGSSTFRDCNSLVTVSLPAALKKIGGNAFAKCSALREVRLASPLPPSITHSTFKGIVTDACRFIVPRNCSHNYSADKQWAKIKHITEN
jgi:hypothetical protein